MIEFEPNRAKICTHIYFLFCRYYQLKNGAGITAFFSPVERVIIPGN